MVETKRVIDMLEFVRDKGPVPALWFTANCPDLFPYLKEKHYICGSMNLIPGGDGYQYWSLAPAGGEAIAAYHEKRQRLEKSDRVAHRAEIRANLAILISASALLISLLSNLDRILANISG